MLIEFSVENFMCFKNEVTFSFEAMEEMDELDIFNPQSRRDIGISGVGKINTVNAVYGANASGKTTLLRAMVKLFRLIMESRKSNEDDDFGIDYFDDNKPATFSLLFTEKQQYYEYIVSLAGKGKLASVSYESLRNITTPETLFMRKQQSVLSDKFLNTNRQEILEADLQKNHLVFSHPFTELRYLRETFSESHVDWFDITPNYFEKVNLPTSILVDMQGFPKFLQEKILYSPTKDFILEELKQADFLVSDFEFEDKELVFIDNKKVKRKFLHQSDGTRKYFLLLLDLKLHILDHGGMYVIDELEKALHPYLALRLINMFKNPQTNPNNARLLFSSHETSFLHHSVLNGDQVWFIQKNYDTDKTQLFSPAQDEKFDALRLQREYMHGLYGAVPNIQLEQ